ncbi:hypothetical protein DIPPA_25485 [Diplonema papillatum]|nr:hypothetical protein DIPPA_25485 [Diplonema papillatum]
MPSVDYPFDVTGYRRSDTTCGHVQRGLVWQYGYHHEEAIACYERSLARDPQNAFALWGIAYCVGPNYNKPWEACGDDEQKASYAAARDHLQRAQAAPRKTPLEASLISALRERYPEDSLSLEKSGAWAQNYANAMRAVYGRHPDDPDAAALFAEAVMGLRPWALWLRTGSPSFPETLEIKSLLEGWLRRGAPHHPGICHFYIHLMELSSEPEAALIACEPLENMIADAGHLTHMPSHIYVQTGDYEGAMRANRRAVEADGKYFASAGPHKFYSLYRYHDLHFLAWAAMLAGNFSKAFGAAQEMVKLTPAAFLTEPYRNESTCIQPLPAADWFESMVAVHIHVLVRFGKWRVIANEDPAKWQARHPETGAFVFTTTRIALSYAKAVAHAALAGVAHKKRDDRAKKCHLQRGREAKDAFYEARRHLAEHTPGRRAMNNLVTVIYDVAEQVLLGELVYREGDVEGGLAHLERAVALCDGGDDPEKNLTYDEPWGWMMPPRQALAALALEAGLVERAAKAHEETLGIAGTCRRAQVYPNNVWDLRGIVECYQKLGKDTTQFRDRLAQANLLTDVRITASCLCQC